MTSPPRDLELHFVFRFLAFGLVMAFVNLVPYLITRGEYATDGVEIAGWPLKCWSAGGAGLFHFDPWAMAANIAVAVAVSAFGGWAFRDGVLATIRKWRSFAIAHPE